MTYIHHSLFSIEGIGVTRDNPTREPPRLLALGDSVLFTHCQESIMKTRQFTTIHVSHCYPSNLLIPVVPACQVNS